VAATPFTFSGTLVRPPVPGQANNNIPVPLTTFSSSFKPKSEDEYDLSGAGTKAVDMAGISSAGAKFFSIEVSTTTPDDLPASAPVNLRVNGGTDDIELSPGGFIIFGSPNPTASGITSLDLVHTQDAKVIVRVYG